MPDDHAPEPPVRAAEAPDRDFPPSRDDALARLTEFVPRAGRDYASGRNHDLPGHPHVSALSPYLRHRAISEAEVCAAVLERQPASAAEKLVQEVVWRTYFKGWMERRPGTWDAYLRGVATGRDRLATEGGLRRGWESACEGETGIAPFDDWARELVRTGYVHNHARMWFASVWIHTLGLPWELGADFFLRHLLDGDPASNTLGWRWVAGLHTRGKTYLARPGNIRRYTGERYAEADLSRLAGDAPALEEPSPPAPADMPEDAAIPKGRVGLILHEDDLHPAYLFARGLEPAEAMVLLNPEGRSPLEVSRKVRDFTDALATDAGERLPCDVAAITRDPAEVTAWAKGFDAVVAPYAPVGPGRAALDRVEAEVARPIRDWDLAAWPFATAGYFKVKSRIPAILEAADG